MKKIFVFLTFTICYQSKAQYSDIDLVNEYNKVGVNSCGFKTGITLPLPSSNLTPYLNTIYGDLSTSTYASRAGDRTSYTLESLIRMYETTKDKAYLYEFMRHALGLIYYRGTCKANCNDHHISEYWYSNYYQFSGNPYHDALLLWALSHFVNMVLYQNPNNIAYEQLHDFDFMQIANNQIKTFTT